MGSLTVTCYSDRAGRRSEDYPEVTQRDDRILKVLWLVGPVSRTYLARLFDLPPRKVTYALNRLRTQGKVRRIREGNEGHGYWVAVRDGEVIKDDGEKREQER